MKFIHLAEKTGLINPIGKWVLQTVCTQNKAWQKVGLPPIRIAVNLSIIQFQNSEIESQIKEILDETKLLPQYLELEITESIAMWDTDNVVRVLNTFKEMGIYISIDDFGTEYSSLRYLKLLPINRIKIPMQFIQGIDVDKKDEEIIKTIIVLSRIMGLDVIAEGVETHQQESFLTQWMCDEIQGFYYYKPMQSKEIEVLLQTKI
jgi:EAL domain-containing protein (putative c-di-GMP-specific phosphodiesterase class I)